MTLLLIAAAVCPLWGDLQKDMPGTLHWQELNRRGILGAQIMYSMAPGTPVELPEADKVYLGTVEGRQSALLFFVHKDQQVCLSPMRVEKDGLKILMELQDGPGDDL